MGPGIPGNIPEPQNSRGIPGNKNSREITKNYEIPLTFPGIPIKFPKFPE